MENLSNFIASSYSSSDWCNPLIRFQKTGLDLNDVFRFVLFSFCFVFGGPGGGLVGPGGGFLNSSKSNGKATTETVKKRATTRTTQTTTRATERKTKRKTKQTKNIF